MSSARGASPRRPGWSGGGGRWLVWTGRVVLWALIIVIVVNGIRAPFERLTQGDQSTQASAEPTGTTFPVTQAAAFANQFAAVYLNYDAANPQQRAERLKAFRPDGVDDQFGWNGYGRMSAGAFQFAGITVVDAHQARVLVTYQAGGSRGVLSVPVFYDGGRFVVSAEPALLPAPPPAGLPQLPDAEHDQAAEAELRPLLDGFFKAYAAGDQTDLQRYVASGVTIDGFNGQFSFAELKKFVVPPGDANSRVVTVNVVWAVGSPSGAAAATPSPDPASQPGGLEQVYQVTVEKQGGKWFVKDVQGANRYLG